MGVNILEAYKGRLAVAESVYSKQHNGEKLPNFKKLATAKCLENVNKFLNEAFENSAGTQRSDLGMFKKFALNLTTVALPNLIAHDLVLVYPMSSMSGYINYLEYTLGSNKGQSRQGDVINSPFALGTFRDGERVPFDSQYTSARVDETNTSEADTTAFTMKWTPVIAGTVAVTTTIGDVTTQYIDDGKGNLYKMGADGVTAVSRVINPDGSVTVDLTLAAGAASVATINYATGALTFAAAPGAGTVAVNYSYNNVVIPQNDLPIINVEMRSMPLIAKARRIAVYYSQIAAFQAKTDYGFDLGDQLAEKAVGELSYEIDTEIVQLLADNATPVLDADGNNLLRFNMAVPMGVSMAEHFEGFAAIVSMAQQAIYDRTRRFAPNYMVISSSLLPLLGFLRGWTASPAGQRNGPYFAGTYNGLKVFVTPNLGAGKFFLGVNGDDMMSSAAVYAPYMPIVPTQLLGFADGAMSQGWSTLYDLKILNPSLLVSGEVYTDVANANQQVIRTAAISNAIVNNVVTPPVTKAEG